MAIYKILVKRVVGAGLLTGALGGIVMALATIITLPAYVGAAGHIGFAGKAAAARMQSHSSCIGQLYPFNGIDIDCQEPVTYLLGRQLSKRRKISDDHQPLYVMGISPFHSLLQTVAHTGHTRFTRPEPSR